MQLQVYIFPAYLIVHTRTPVWSVAGSGASASNSCPSLPDRERLLTTTSTLAFCFCNTPASPVPSRPPEPRRRAGCSLTWVPVDVSRHLPSQPYAQPPVGPPFLETHCLDSSKRRPLLPQLKPRTRLLLSTLPGPTLAALHWRLNPGSACRGRGRGPGPGPGPNSSAPTSTFAPASPVPPCLNTASNPLATRCHDGFRKPELYHLQPGSQLPGCRSVLTPLLVAVICHATDCRPPTLFM